MSEELTELQLQQKNTLYVTRRLLRLLTYKDSF